MNNLFYSFNDYNKKYESISGKKAFLQAWLYNQEINVPFGYILTSDLYDLFLDVNNLQNKVHTILNSLTRTEEINKKIESLFLKASFPIHILEQLKKIHTHFLEQNIDSYAIRSSALYEDSSDFSSAGQHDSILKIKKFSDIIIGIKKVYASLFTSRAQDYRNNLDIPQEKIKMAILWQGLIFNKNISSGVLFTTDPNIGFESICIYSNFGLGENIVQGLKDTDFYRFTEESIAQGCTYSIEKKITKKNIKQNPESISSNVAYQLALIAIKIKTLWKIDFNQEVYLDCEWVYDKKNNTLYIVQVRPETIFKSKDHKISYTSYNISLKDSNVLLNEGIGCFNGVVSGIIFKADSIEQARKMPENSILVVEYTTPDWLSIMKKAKGIITEKGSASCHAAIVAREQKIPTIVSCKNIFSLANGQTISLYGEGNHGKVYSGIIDFTEHIHTLEQKKNISAPLYAIISNPEHAFIASKLPFEGIGLLRLEFLLSDAIGIHPNALINFKTMPDKIKNAILKKISPYIDPIDFFKTELSRSIAAICYAFHNKDVIVRFSDFKSHEYKHLIGGLYFEKNEENPMIGLRGALRYLSPEYKDAFSLELDVIKNVIENFKVTNLKVMVPFVRTVDEIKEVSKLIKEKLTCEIFMMVEVPSNVLLLEEFALYVDGFSIGSNDLLQLTLGIDRDSNHLSNYSLIDPAVKVLIEMAVLKAKKMNKKIGICGEAPALYPKFRNFLDGLNIDSISINYQAIASFYKKPPIPI